ncbi:hypothetical protein TorRG33x02_308440 [Trema orientale]|uniref:Uncharacterized protein n=1 Tax=Trema orientale TaxID=63057 RepID=A0A2P5BUE1_TREOI|nr:hypothetical protein TorRG33x02_308440 [Trema orientale]
MLSGTRMTHSYLPHRLNLSTTLMMTKVVHCGDSFTIFTPHNIWDFLDVEKDIERVSTSSELWVDLPVIKNIEYHREDIEPGNTSNIDELLHQTRVMTMDDFVVDDDDFEDDTLEKYKDEKIDLCKEHTPTGFASSNSSSGDRLDLKGKSIREESHGIIVEKELRK